VEIVNKVRTVYMGVLFHFLHALSAKIFAEHVHNRNKLSDDNLVYSRIDK